jgi:DNA-binding response OmpR family regulator
MSPRILVVDDDPSVLRMLTRSLTAEGHDVESAADGGAALAAVERRAPEAVVLDVAMTARDTVADRVAGLEAGADDYLVKPFAVAELLARLAAIERRGRPQSSLLSVGALALDPVAREVRRDGRAIALTARESELLELLLLRARSVVTRELAIDEIWGSAAVDNVVDRTVMSLRRKLGAPDLIRTVRGTGFVLEP